MRGRCSRMSINTYSHTGIATDEIASHPVTSGAPEFLRLPHPGQRCSVTGLSRSYLNQLILPCKLNSFRPPVRSFVLRKRGAKTGVRLIDYASLRSYIRSHEQEPSASNTSTILN
jgi:hypothetical protein